MRCIHAGCTKRLKGTHRMYVTDGMKIERPCIGDMILPMKEDGVVRMEPASASASGAVVRIRDIINWKYRKVVNTAIPSMVWVDDGRAPVRPAM
jgi:hypothetical protein